MECFMTVAGKVGLTGRSVPISERRRQTSPSPYSMLLSKAIVAAFTYCCDDSFCVKEDDS